MSVVICPASANYHCIQGFGEIQEKRDRSKMTKASPSSLSLLCVFLYILCVCGENYGLALEDLPREKVARYVSQDLPAAECDKKLAKKGNGGMWFGPRLGKRDRLQSLLAGQASLPLQRLLLEAMAAADAKTLEDLPDFMGNSYEITGTKRRFTPRLGRESGEVDSRHVEFVPRLGRELAMSLPASALSSDNDVASAPLYGRYAAEERAPLFADSGAPPFAPRLGRELAEYYNSLGLTSHKDNLSRVVRSAELSRTHKEHDKKDNHAS